MSATASRSAGQPTTSRTCSEPRKDGGYEIFVSPHDYYPRDRGWAFGGTLERMMHEVDMFDRRRPLTLEGFEGSGADWLERYNPYIEHGRTVVVSPHKVYGPQNNDLVKQGFEVAVVTDATAAANHPERGNGYPAALTNFGYLANGAATTGTSSSTCAPRPRQRPVGDLVFLLFDLNGTLTDARAIGAAWASAELGPAALAEAVQTAAVDALTARYRPFAEHLRAAVEVEARARGLDVGMLDEVMEGAAALPAHPDADAALTSLRRAGHRLAVLTNSGADSGRQTLEAAGLADHFEKILGVDAVNSYKPHPSTYEHALQELSVEPTGLMLVAAHQWDVTGAKRAGLRTAWIDREAEPFSAVAEPPDVRVTSLADLAAALTPA